MVISELGIEARLVQKREPSHGPPIIDVTDYNDIDKAIDDGRLKKIIEEHKRYMKETGAEIWNT
jgi:hypothetical protein